MKKGQAKGERTLKEASCGIVASKSALAHFFEQARIESAQIESAQIESAQIESAQIESGDSLASTKKGRKRRKMCSILCYHLGSQGTAGTCLASTAVCR